MENLLAALTESVDRCLPSFCSSHFPICRELRNVNEQIQQVVDRSRMRKIVTGTDDAILVQRLIKKVDWAVANMMVRSAHSHVSWKSTYSYQAGVSLNSASSVQVSPTVLRSVAETDSPP